MKKNYLLTILLTAFLFINIYPVNSQTATFDNLILPVDSFWNGEDNSGGFTNGGYSFQNSYTGFGGGLYSWYGFAYSNKSDTLTNGYTNQFSAITGNGALNSANYAVSYVNYDWMNNYQMQPNIIRLTTPKTISGFYAANTTYAYFSMLNGDGTLAKKFGGLSGNDTDWLKLQIKGYRNGNMTDTVNCFLADFRFTDNSQDYILKTWKWVDLSVLGDIDSLSFGLTSTDNGLYGMNTPSYFCMDNFNGQNPNVGVNNINNSDIQLSIYPNPFVETIRIKSNSKIEYYNVTIYSLNGQEVMKTGIVNNNITISTSELQSGVYFIKITGLDFNHYQKIIKK